MPLMSTYECLKGFENIPSIGTLALNIILMSKNTSVLLGERYEKFIAKEVSTGRYNSASEVIRTALRLLEEREELKLNLKKALIAGEKSGFVDNFDPQKNLESLHKRFV
jgi:antitoxin ParD1/3/4